MRRAIRASQLIVIAFAALLVWGCGGKQGSNKAKMEIASLGVSMNIPRGWVLDNPQMCHKGRCCTGVLMDEPIGEGGFEDAATKMSKEFGSKILSQRTTTIGGHKAIIAHLQGPEGGNVLRVYVEYGDRIVWASFMIGEGEPYSRYEADLMRSVKSMKL